MHAGLFCVDLKKTTEWETLCLNYHKELLQDSSVKMLVLQLPSGSLAGQKPHIYPWFSQVCESWLDCASLVPEPQGAGLQALVVSAVLVPGEGHYRAALLGHRLPQLIPHLCSWTSILWLAPKTLWSLPISLVPLSSHAGLQKIYNGFC